MVYTCEILKLYVQQLWPVNVKFFAHAHMYMHPQKPKTCLKWPLKKNTKKDFQYQLSLNAGLKYCRMLQGEHSAILSTFIKLPFVLKTFVLSIFEWSLQTGFCCMPQILDIGGDKILEMFM